MHDLRSDPSDPQQNRSRSWTDPRLIQIQIYRTRSDPGPDLKNQVWSKSRVKESRMIQIYKTTSDPDPGLFQVQMSESKNPEWSRLQNQDKTTSPIQIYRTRSDAGPHEPAVCERFNVYWKLERSVYVCVFRKCVSYRRDTDSVFVSLSMCVYFLLFFCLLVPTHARTHTHMHTHTLTHTQCEHFHSGSDVF